MVQYMPPRNYVSITVRKEIYERLEYLRTKLRYNSIGDLIIFLINFYEDNIGVKERIDKVVEMLKKCVE